MPTAKNKLVIAVRIDNALPAVISTAGWDINARNRMHVAVAIPEPTEYWPIMPYPELILARIPPDSILLLRHRKRCGFILLRVCWKRNEFLIFNHTDAR